MTLQSSIESRKLAPHGSLGAAHGALPNGPLAHDVLMTTTLSILAADSNCFDPGMQSKATSLDPSQTMSLTCLTAQRILHMPPSVTEQPHHVA